MDLSNKLQENVVDYCKELSHEDLQNLVIYLGNEIEANVKPTKIQQEFCETFLGAVNYADFLKYWSLPEKERPIFSNTKIIRSDLNELYMYVSWQANLRIGKLLLEVSDWKVKASKLELKIADKKLKTAKLKEDLSNAVLDSYEGNIFYKDDGWCNISDVLVKHKLIKLEE
jgi:hypothetical protein